MLLKLIRAIRPINLLIIVLTFFVLYKLDANSREFLSRTFYLEIISLKFLAIATILIAAAGYLINDYYDTEIDKINKPHRKSNIPPGVLLIMYSLLNGSGLYISFVFSNSIWVFSLFPVAIFLLWLYSYQLKGMLLIGNLSIAMLSALIPLIYLWQQETYLERQTTDSQIAAIELTLLFAILAFFGTFSREIIKDIEDIDGDQASHLKTIPIIMGIKIAKGISIFFSFITLLLLCLIAINYEYFNFSNASLIIVFFISAVPLLLAITKTYLATEKKHFKQAGNLIKLAMFGFILFIYLHAITL